MDTNRELRILSGKLSSLRKKDYIPSGLVDLAAKAHESFVTATVKAKVDLPHPNELPTADQLAQGAPLVPRNSFPFDAIQASDLFFEHLDMLKKSHDSLTQAAKEIEKAVRSNELTPDQAFEELLADRPGLFTDWAGRTPNAPKSLAFVTQCAMAPSIARTGRDLAVFLPKDSIWKHGHCPVCGSLPHMAELRDKEGYRYLSCSFCRHQYRVRRLSCPFCNETDFEKLSFFTSDQEPGFRIDVCTSCSMYVKTSDFRSLDKVSLPVIDDLESLVLDVLAADKGYSRPTNSCWGF